MLRLEVIFVSSIEKTSLIAHMKVYKMRQVSLGYKIQSSLADLIEIVENIITTEWLVYLGLFMGRHSGGEWKIPQQRQ